MTISRLQTDLSRLLLQCETLEASDAADGNWRYPQYVKALQTQYELLKNSPAAPSADTLKQFRRRIDHLQSAVAPLPADDVLTPVAPSATSCASLATPIIRVSGQTAGALAELRQRRAGRAQNSARAQLLAAPDAERSSSASSASSPAEQDVEQVLQRHHRLQERAADQMLALTRNLKQQSLVAKHVIAGDRETLESSSRLTDRNATSLQKQSDRLSEFTARACRCWLWMLLGVVCLTFMAMVVFIRIFGKKVRAVPAAAEPASPATDALSPPESSAPTQSDDGLLCGWLGWLLPLCNGPVDL